MCEIFAMSSAGRRCVDRRLIEFYSHSKEHPNGWGLMVSSGGLTNWEKEPVRADRSGYLKHRLSEPVSSETVLAHIRYATVGNVSRANCHPFVAQDINHRQWILIHNGTIFDYPPCNKYVKIQQGETDSERILLFLMDKLAAKSKSLERELNEEERFLLLEDLIAGMSPKNKLNLLIFDGEILYGHCNMKGTLHRCEEKGISLLSTRPLTEGHWEEAPFCRLFAYKNSVQIMEGRKQSEEYFEDEQAISALYLDYAGL